MAAPATTNFHGVLPIILSDTEGYPTGDGELDEIEFDVLCTRDSWESELTALDLLRGKLLPAAFPYHAMFVHAMAPIAATEETITIKVRCKGLIANYNKALHELGYDEGSYTPTGATSPVFVPMPAVVSVSFVTTSAAAYTFVQGDPATPPITLPDPYGGMADRSWITGRQHAVIVYQGDPLDTVQGLWKVTKTLWYAPDVA